MSMITRLVGMLVLVLAMGAAQAQNTVPSERALEVLVKTSLLSFNDANEGGLQGVQREEHRYRAYSGAQADL